MSDYGVNLPLEIQRCRAADLAISEETINEGTFGVVYAGRHISLGINIAYKQLRTSIIRETDKMAGQLQREAFALNYRHRNLVRLLGVVFEPSHYGVVLEFASYGPLDRFLSNFKGKVEFPVKISFAADIADGLDFLHSQQPPVVHGELKLRNVLIADNFVAKISDFCLSKWKQYSIRSTGSKSKDTTIIHIPPENWLNINLKWTCSYDVYGFGILLWELCTEEKAFQGGSDVRLTVVNGQRPDLEQIRAGTIKVLIEECWQQEPKDRPSSSNIVHRLKELREEHETAIKLSIEKLDRIVKRFPPVHSV